jgi:hypothetical protein
MTRWPFALSLVSLLMLNPAFKPGLTTYAPATADLLVYDDALQNSFQDWSWAPHSLVNTSPVYSGTQSISVSYAADFDGVWFVKDPGPAFDLTDYVSLQFAVHGGSTGGQQLSIKVGDQAGSSTTYPTAAVSLNDYLPGGPAANQWSVVTIPLSAFGLSAFGNVAFQSDVAGSQPTFYIDDLRLIGDSTPPVTSATVRIQTLGAVTPIDPRVFGSNLPTWLGPARLEDSTFRARTIASGLTVIRLPGGSWSNGYNWLDCENFVAPCDWAARPTDFLNFLKATNTEGVWVVSPNGTSKEAAALVAFFNASTGDPTPIGVDLLGRDWFTAGYWAQLRSDHGNPEPYPIKLWEVGNEVYGGLPGPTDCVAWGWEDVWTCDGTEYVNGITGHEGYLAFQDEMRAVDPTILVAPVGVPYASSWTNWGNEVIAGAGDVMDFYGLHQYAYFTPPATYAEALAQPQTEWDNIRADLDAAYTANAGGRAIPSAVTEYNLFSGGDLDTGQWMTRAVNALFMGDTLGQIVENRFFLANQWDLANGVNLTSGTDYSLINADTWERYPQYYVFPLWARFGPEMLPLTSTVSAANALSAYAGRISAQTLSVLAINKTGSPITTTLEFDSPLTLSSGTADVVLAASLDATTVTFNGVSDPADDLSDAPPVTLGSVSNPLVYTFAPYSITLLRLNTIPPTLMPGLYLPLIRR